MNATPSSVVGAQTVQLATNAVVPESDRPYLIWHKVQGGSRTELARGTTATQTEANATTTFSLSYEGGPGCYRSGQVTVPYTPLPPCAIKSKATAFCSQLSYDFWVTPMPAERGYEFEYEWRFNGQLIDGGEYITHRLPSSGILTINVFRVLIDNGDGGGGDRKKKEIQTAATSGNRFRDNVCSYSKSISVTQSVPLSISASTSAFCDSSPNRDVYLSLPGVPSQFASNVNWSSIPAGYSGTGLNFPAQGVSQTTTFNASYSGGGCFLPPQPLTVTVYKTEVDPVVALNRTYRSAQITISPEQLPAADHYWQRANTLSDLNRTSLSNKLVGKSFTVTQSGYYFLRSYVASANCWTNPSQVLNLQLNLTPPKPVVSQIKRLGYSELYLTSEDIDRTKLFASYFFVDNENGTATDKAFTDGKLMFEEKRVFVRGRDNESGTWGQSLALDLALRSDNELNWTFARTFDGTKESDGTLRVISESKNYFDQRGQALQSQTKTFHYVTQGNTTTETPFVFASQSLKDKYDRTVGGTLSAPIQQNDFLYNGAFALNDNGKPLSYADFDKAQPLATDQKGTLGNYFSAQNAWGETQVPKAKRLFSRTDFYEDGTGEERKSAQPGDTHFIGSGKEVVKGTFPVGNDATKNELKDYLSKRGQVFTGSQPSLLEGVQTVVRDENGRFAVSISDKSGKVLITARKGGNDATQCSISSDKMAYFYVMGTESADAQQVTINGTGSYTIENTLTNAQVDKITGALPHVYT
ncbi:MAG: hypothetical protein ACKOE6_13590, partial [Flammeovirgaceae bacterium]